MRNPWVIGVSGASGTLYTRTVLNALLDAGEPVDLVVSRAARLTLLDELGLSFRDSQWRADLESWLGRSVDDVQHWTPGDFAAVPSSYCDGQTVHSTSYTGTVGEIDTAALRARFPTTLGTFNGNENGGTAQTSNGRPNT